MKAAKTIPQKPASVPDTVQREIKSAKPLLDKESKSEFDLPKAAAVPEKTVQRELNENAGKQIHTDADNTVRREIKPGTLMHYEMPQQQIDAIRSGNKADTVRREMDHESSEKPHQMAAPVIQPPTVRRESNFVLPKTQSSNKAQEESAGSVIQRAYAAWNSDNRFSGLPFPGMGNMGKQGPSLNSSQKMSGKSSSGNDSRSSSTIQREMLGDLVTKAKDAASSATSAAQSAVSSAKTAVSSVFSKNEPDTSEKDDNDAAEKVLETLLPEITSQQLEELADKLLPRIKRIMRAEMERSLFR